MSEDKKLPREWWVNLITLEVHLGPMGDDGNDIKVIEKFAFDELKHKLETCHAWYGDSVLKINKLEKKLQAAADKLEKKQQKMERKLAIAIEALAGITEEPWAHYPDCSPTKIAGEAIAKMVDIDRE